MKHLKEGLIKQKGKVRLVEWVVILPYGEDFKRFKNSEYPQIIGGTRNFFIIPYSEYEKQKFKDPYSMAWRYLEHDYKTLYSFIRKGYPPKYSFNDLEFERLL